jgi:hypothetical protein
MVKSMKLITNHTIAGKNFSAFMLTLCFETNLVKK